MKYHKLLTVKWRTPLLLEDHIKLHIYWVRTNISLRCIDFESMIIYVPMIQILTWYLNSFLECVILEKNFVNIFLICFDSYYGFWWWNEQRSSIYLLFFFVNFLIRFFFFFPPGFQDFSMLLKNSDTIHASDESSVCIYIFFSFIFLYKNG